MIEMYEFNRTTNGFNYVFEKVLSPNEELLLKMPTISPNKRGFNDIGWQASGNVDLYGTLALNPRSERAIWQKIEPFDEVNKTISALKIKNGGTECTIVIRALLN